MFDQNKTEEQDFYVSANEKFCVEMMYRPATKFNYGRSDSLHCQVIGLPYDDGKLRRIVLLPDENMTLSMLESSLTVDDLIDISSKLWMDIG